MGREAGQDALTDAGISYDKIQAVVASYCYGEPTCGQRAAYELGLSGVPIFNVNNNCSSGSSALMLARRLVQSGLEDCVLVPGNCFVFIQLRTFTYTSKNVKLTASFFTGFEKMERGLSERYNDRTSPVKPQMDHMVSIGAEAAREYMKKYPDTKVSDFVNIAYKNHRHSVNNPKATIQKAIPPEVIRSKLPLCQPITFWMSAPVSDGGAAAIVCSEDFVRKHGLEDKAVEIIAQHMVTDTKESFQQSFMDLSGYKMAQRAAQLCYQDTKLSPSDVDVLEVHDCFSCNEMFMYEALQLAREGEGAELIRNAKWIKNSNGGELCVMNGRWVVNPSGGLESKGHPIGATGLAQCAELVWQLRDQAGKRQVEGAKVAMQHNYGIGGAAVVTMYRRYKDQDQRLLARL
ncbi:hypothetical protein FSP39_016630 [Pinctada imbricata]|uniref:Non-specific lipid-transfer protein n=1 Tax=Pinctada imbricata TaxID=66713 RepID=A0AA89BPZ1_PINIB|nr:hypothetical protein FSP39_016630 [Pinctada imbricata]